MLIRKANKGDAREIARVHVDSWRTTYTGIIPDDFLRNLSYENRTALWENNTGLHDVYVAETNSLEIVGFAAGGRRRTDKYEAYPGELYAIYIMKEFQGKGIGKQLVQPVVENLLKEEIDSMIVLVIEDNPSKYFYEALGARKIDAIKVKISGVDLTELVYAWDALHISFKKE
ncbi:GNAT family N-acetyltransferase [Oceanobacillus bengalensis]|uniref:GNAT family N-acetyltransferase n=1 Tax=Oceanobacillus bengalensis TaxID=1435466 RepID=A0A494Z816_9BACI|nr:GNAT family N-acetyltransferase [Oceanobacillus bengalensis]RKQ18677.1 GNAT family N-acetyltransferase [Oceanobacillus bengalensis]